MPATMSKKSVSLSGERAFIFVLFYVFLIALYVLIQDVPLKTCKKQWTIETSGDRRSGKSVPGAHHDDDQDIYIYIYILTYTHTHIYIYIYI